MVDPGTAMLVGTGVNVVGGLIGGNRAARAAADQADRENQATIRRYEYDIAKYDLDRQQIRANRNFAVQEILTKQSNEGKVADFRDASAAQQYNYNLSIRNQQQSSNEAQFERSEQRRSNSHQNSRHTDCNKADHSQCLQSDPL